MNINNIKTGIPVKDTKRLIDGIIIRVFGCQKKEDFKIHVEFKRFKGDDEPFVIEYTKKEIIKDIFPLYSNIKNFNKHTFFLTVGRLKESLKKTRLPDDSLVMIEQPKNINKDNIFKTEDILKDGLVLNLGQEYLNSSGCGCSIKDFKFFINYNF